MSDAERNLVRDALRFYAWAAGEGFYSTDVAVEPEEALYNYAAATGDEDYDGYPDKIAAMLPARPIAWRYVHSDGKGTSYWFDCEENADLLAEKLASFKIEYAYPVPAKAAGIRVKEA